MASTFSRRSSLRGMLQGFGAGHTPMWPARAAAVSTARARTAAAPGARRATEGRGRAPPPPRDRDRGLLQLGGEHEVSNVVISGIFWILVISRAVPILDLATPGDEEGARGLRGSWRSSRSVSNRFQRAR